MTKPTWQYSRNDRKRSEPNLGFELLPTDEVQGKQKPSHNCSLLLEALTHNKWFTFPSLAKVMPLNTPRFEYQMLTDKLSLHLSPTYNKKMSLFTTLLLNVVKKNKFLAPKTQNGLHKVCTHSHRKTEEKLKTQHLFLTSFLKSKSDRKKHSFLTLFCKWSAAKEASKL